MATTGSQPTVAAGSDDLKAVIVIIRHAEKLNWTEGMEPTETQINAFVDNHKLSVKGLERAQALVAYFRHREEMVNVIGGHGFDYIINQAVDHGPNPFGQSERPVECFYVR